jgi:hypothetical protein
MEIKSFPELIKMNKESVKYYSRITTNYFFRRNGQIRKISDEKERLIESNKLEADSYIYTTEITKYVKWLRLTSGDKPKRRYSI